MLGKKFLTYVLVAALLVASVPVRAELPGNTGLLRLSIPFGGTSEKTEPWLGLGFSHKTDAVAYRPWDDAKASWGEVSFNLRAPQAAFTMDDTRAVVSWDKAYDYQANVCGVDPDRVDRSNSGATRNLLLATSAALMMGILIYLYTTGTFAGVCIDQG